MNLDLSEEHELVRQTVREFATERIAPVAEELDRESRFPYELVAELADLGLMGMPIPEAYGGAGSDTLAYAIAVPEMLYVSSQIWSDELNVPVMMNVLLICYFVLVGILVYLMHRWERAIRVPGFGI